MNLKGKTISFEGGEGSGKSTLLKNLAIYLENNGYDVVKTREPGGAKISEQIRNIIVDKNNKEISAQTEALLFAAARAQFMNDVILPAVQEEKTILIDRFIDSSLVYQGIARDLGVENVWNINLFATNGWLPDCTIILDIDPKEGLKRIADNNRSTNRLDEESLDFHYKVRDGYLEIAKNNARIHVIDANQNPEKIVEDVLKILEKI